MRAQSCPGPYGELCGQPVTHVYHGLVVQVPLCARCAADVQALLRRYAAFGRPDAARLERVAGG